MPNYKIIMLAVGVVGLMAAGSLTSVSAADYSGKTFTFIVGASPAGGQTRAARALARYIGNHLPGNPDVIVKNLPGAGGNKSKNFIYNKVKKRWADIALGASQSDGRLA